MLENKINLYNEAKLKKFGFSEKDKVIKAKSFKEDGGTVLMLDKTDTLHVCNYSNKYGIYEKNEEDVFNDVILVEDYVETQLLNRCGFYCKSMSNDRENKGKRVLSMDKKAEIADLGFKLDKGYTFLVIRNGRICGILSEKYIPLDPKDITSSFENWLTENLFNYDFSGGMTDHMVTSLYYEIKDDFVLMPLVSKISTGEHLFTNGKMFYRLSFSENGFSSVRVDIIIKLFSTKGVADDLVITIPNVVVMKHKGDASIRGFEEKLNNKNIFEPINKTFDYIERMGKTYINDIGKTLLGVYENEKSLILPKKNCVSAAEALKGKSGTAMDVYLELTKIIDQQIGNTESIINIIDAEEKKNKLMKVNYSKYDN